MHCDAVQEAFKQYPELFGWITAQPDEALVKAFIKYREDLQCVPLGSLPVQRKLSSLPG